ncbi:hypothetical protein [Streptomyces sp. NPDC012508]|uniref:hypothetical protein n=1 Tax=Streptomyces sp. NPDC012508 TaxID=3364837 RepID=UPI00369EBC99
MSVILPNSFACTARTAVLSAPRPIDLRPLAQRGLPGEITEQLGSVSRFLVTTSRVHSSVSSEHFIDFAETLVKIPVRLDSQDFLFPVVTYVDHEYSLIRGYLLGFHKLFAAGAHGEALPTVTVGGLDLDLRDLGPAAGDENDLPPEQSLPFLLWTDYAVAEAKSHGWRTLVVDEYVRTDLTFLHHAREEQMVGGARAAVLSLYEVTDQFVIPGTQALERSARG